MSKDRNQLDSDALDYMRLKLADTQEFRVMAEDDKLVLYTVIEQAICYYNEGCHKKFLLTINNHNGAQ